MTADDCDCRACEARRLGVDPRALLFGLDSAAAALVAAVPTGPALQTYGFLGGLVDNGGLSAGRAADVLRAVYA